MLSYIFGRRSAPELDNRESNSLNPAESPTVNNTTNNATANVNLDELKILKDEMLELREQIETLKRLLIMQPATRQASQQATQQATRQSSQQATQSAAWPTYTELVNEFGAFELERHYQQLKRSNDDLPKLERLYYFEYLKRVADIREETLRTIQDFYDLGNAESIDYWMAENPMVPSRYFAGKYHLFHTLSRYCTDVSFIEANLSHMSASQLRENPALPLSFFAKHKIIIEAPEIFSHDVTQEFCESADMLDEYYERLSYNPRAPVAFMTANADKVNWQIASQHNSTELLEANPTRVIKELAESNLNLCSTKRQIIDLQYVVLNPMLKYGAVNKSNLVKYYNSDWRQKLFNGRAGAFADWKKYLFYTGNTLNMAQWENIPDDKIDDADRRRVFKKLSKQNPDDYCMTFFPQNRDVAKHSNVENLLN